MHDPEAVLAAGEPLDSARAAMILVHGRGAGPEDIMTVAAELPFPGFAYLAPRANGGTWYPYSFMQPLESNQPHLGSALGVLGTLLARVTRRVPREKVVLLGFSQGACLALEFAARNAGRFGALIGLSGGLIGPEGTPRDYPGSFDGTPAFLGCSDVDPHIPPDRVRETAAVLERMGARVRVELYPGMGHLVSPAELAVAREMLAPL